MDRLQYLATALMALRPEVAVAVEVHHQEAAKQAEMAVLVVLFLHTPAPRRAMYGIVSPAVHPHVS
jgi:hypothetical protein